MIFDSVIKFFAYLLALLGLKSSIDERREPIPADLEIILGKFEGLFTPLWRAAFESDLRVRARQQTIVTWQTRIKNTDSTALIKSWNKLLEKNLKVNHVSRDANFGNEELQSLARDWLNLLTFWGVNREQISEFQIDEKNELTFIIEPLSYDYGDKAKVISPRWFFNNSVIEKGTAQVIENGETKAVA